MAAEKANFDSSFNNDHREDDIDRMVGDVLEDSFEEIPEATDEFWKPVISADRNMNRQQHVDVTKSPMYLETENIGKQSEYPLPAHSVIDNNCSCLDEGVPLIHRSKSEDILCKNQFDQQAAYYESYPMQQNYVTMPNKKSNLSDSLPSSNLSDSLPSIEGKEPSDRFLLGDKGFKSFFDEYDKKLDCLEIKHTAIDDSFSGMQSILMEFENFVSFIENQYERLETNDTRAVDPNDDAITATGNEDKDVESDIDEDVDTKDIDNKDQEQATIEKDIDVQVDKSEPGHDREELDKCVDTTITTDTTKHMSVENDDKAIEEKEKSNDDEHLNKENEERLNENCSEVEKQHSKEDDEDKQSEKGECDPLLEESDDTRCNLAVDMRSFLMCLNSALQEMFSRFQDFVNEVGETVHLGALATQHSQRMDSWASHLQRLYNSLKTDHNNMQEYIEQKEKDWVKIRSQLHAELETQSHQIQEVITALKQHEDIRRKGERLLSKRVGDRLLRKSELCKSLDKLDNNLVDILQKRRCDQEHAMALDFSRQLKIAELKMVLVRQQSYIQRLELQNKELDGVLRGVLFDPDTEQFSGNYFARNPSQTGESFNTMTDILHCDNASYLPGKSTDPDIVGSQTFDIGPKPQRLSAEMEMVFDPKMLKYMCQETLAAINSDMAEIGSGEKVKQGCDPEMIQAIEVEAKDINNSRTEKEPTKAKTEPTEHSPEPVLDLNGNINLSLI
ncbi:uncharacterized protein LOC132564450 [Ylistrum balloti]|uniref:uncharacterized protein LOC132564450 n=1 Tax=Ylistrum balloti TaxID=509963 RepID=UPI0029058535|nr:uncharacterized protein LOC132564450 [Ylistrum balloti]